MHLVMTSSIDQSTRSMGIENLIRLMEFADKEWADFKNSNRRTMVQTIRVPKDIEFLVLQGEKYQVARCKFWFKNLNRGYSPHEFYIADARDLTGRRHQLSFNCLEGTMFEDEKLVKISCVEQSRHVRRPMSGTGPLTRD